MTIGRRRDGHKTHFIGGEVFSGARATELHTAMWLAFTASSKKGIGSSGLARPGTMATDALSTTWSLASKASSNAAQPVDPQSLSFTEDAPLGKHACTGIGSFAIAHEFADLGLREVDNDLRAHDGQSETDENAKRKQPRMDTNAHE